MTRLSMAVLGPPQIQLDNNPLDVDTRKAIALLVYLALATEPQRRDSLTALFWPEAETSHARNNFRRTLSTLKSAVGENWLEIDRETVALIRHEEYWNDVEEFEAKLAGWRRHEHEQDALCPECIADLERAAELYRGDFLEGFSLSGSPEFDHWQSRHTERLRQKHIEGLEKLIEAVSAAGEFERAIQYAQGLLALDPLHEPGHRKLMRLHYWNGDRPAALKQYQRCVQLLDNELGVPAMESTQRLHDQIRQGEREPLREVTEDTTARDLTSQAPANPYKGLFAFTEKDSSLFFGREVFTKALLEEVQRKPLVAVIGPSGSGKSSVVRAGLIARLSNDPAWRVTVCRPGSQPYHSLASALRPLLEGERDPPADEREAGELADALYRGEESLSSLLTTREHETTSHVLLVVDQFEELYTLCSDADRRLRYVDTMLEPSRRTRTQPRIVVALTLRADFLSQALSHRRFADALQDTDLKLGPMTDKEVERAIRLPARQAGVEFEPGLVDRILADLARAPGRLPLLQFALTAMWEQRDGPMLTHAGYGDIGGVSGALAYHAERVYASLAPEDQQRIRQVLVQLVQPGQGTEDTRRLATREELGGTGWKAVQKLADARLAVTGRTPDGTESVEVVHEALIHGWDRLRGWIEADRAFRLWQERLRAAKDQWEDSHRDEGALLRGALLTEAEGWLERRPDELSPREKEYIQAGLALHDRQQRDRESRRRRLLFGLGVGLLLTLVLAGFAALQWRQAASERDAGRRARSRQLSVQASSAVNDEIDLALLLGVEAIQSADTGEARDSLRASLRRSGHMTFLRGHRDSVFDLNLNPAGTRLVSISARQLLVWDLESNELMYGLGDDGPRITGAEVSPDDHTLAVGHEDGTIALHELESGDKLSQATVDQDQPVADFVFSPDGKQVTSFSCPRSVACTEPQIRSWDVASGTPVTRPFQFKSELPIGSGGGNLTGQKIVLGTMLRGDILLADVEERHHIILQRAAHPGGVTAVDISPDETTVVSGGVEGQLRLWDVDSGELSSSPLQGHSGRITALSFDPQGEQLISADATGTLLLWRRFDAGPQGTPLFGYSAGVSAARFTSDGERLVTGHGDGTIVLWNLETVGAGVAVQAIRGDVISLAFNPRGDRLALATLDESIQLHDKAALELLSQWEVEISPPVAMTFSPDGGSLAGADDNGNIALWELPSGEVLQVIEEAHSGPIVSLAFLDHSRLVSITGSQVSRVWDLETGTALGEPAEGPEGAFFGRPFLSPDGELAARGTIEGPVYLWDPLSGEPLGEPLSGPNLPIAGIGFHPTESILAGGGCAEGDVNTGQCHAGEIWLWDWRSGEALGEPLRGNPGGVNRVAFGPEGRLLAAVDASAAGSGNAFVWDTETRDLLAEPLEFGVDLSQVDFSASGEHIAILGGNLDAFLWRYTVHTGGSIAQIPESIEDQISTACQRAGRNLSETEWEVYFPGEPYEETCPVR